MTSNPSVLLVGLYRMCVKAILLYARPTFWILAFRHYHVHQEGRQERRPQERTEESEHFSRGTAAELALAIHPLVLTRVGHPSQANGHFTYGKSLLPHRCEGKKENPRGATIKGNRNPKDQLLARQSCFVFPPSFPLWFFCKILKTVPCAIQFLYIYCIYKNLVVYVYIVICVC